MDENEENVVSDGIDDMVCDYVNSSDASTIKDSDHASRPKPLITIPTSSGINRLFLNTS